jgi:hypothetical protein
MRDEEKEIAQSERGKSFAIVKLLAFFLLTTVVVSI